MRNNTGDTKQLVSNIVALKYLDDLFKGMDSSIGIILLKGASLLNTVYAQDLGARHLGDADILVKKEDFLEIKNYLSDKGYIFHNNINIPCESDYLNSVICKKEEKFWPPFHIHWHLNNASSPNLAFSAKIDLEKIWQEAQQLNGYKNIYIMSAHHQIIHLCEHALKHGYEQEYFFKDIDRAVRYYGSRLDWDKLICAAKNFNLARPAYYTLYFASRILGAEIPPYVLSALKPEKFTFLEKRFMKAVLRGNGCLHLSDVVYLAMHRNIFAKIKFVFRVFIPPPNAMRQIKNVLPHPVNPCDYLMRLYRGFLYSLQLARILGDVP